MAKKKKLVVPIAPTLKSLPPMNYMQISTEIENKYKDSPARKRLAEKCLEKGKEWIETFYGESGTITDADRKRIKKECTAYIKKNVDTTDEVNVYGSVLLMIVFGAVVSWLIQRLLDEMFP